MCCYKFSVLRQLRILFFIAPLFPGAFILAQNVKQEDFNTDFSQFESSTRHWYKIYDKGNIINPLPSQKRYNQEDIKEIADNILLYQRNNGGWPKNYDMQAILTPQQKDSLIITKNSHHTTFDNHTTFTHIDFLAKAYMLTGDEKYKQAGIKGIEFSLAAQYPNGGWPQFFPLENSYSRRITFNDGAYIGIMVMLCNILDNRPYYSFLDSSLRERVKVAYEKGLDCILKCQIRDNGRLTAWCQQHDEVDFSPAWARAFEPPSICNGESAGIVLFLMRIKNPSQEIIYSIESAIKWFDESKIYGIKVKEIKIPAEKTRLTVITTDKIVVSDSTAPPIWARYYELGTHKPLFCNRDRKVVYSLAEVERERRSGYGWYTYDPQEVLDKYPAWKKNLFLDTSTQPMKDF
jgi:PelA/Pel-15E family pectate lyase